MPSDSRPMKCRVEFLLFTLAVSSFHASDVEHLAGSRWRLVNELCALSEDLTAAESVVTYLGVAHVVVGGQTYPRHRAP